VRCLSFPLGATDGATLGSRENRSPQPCRHWLRCYCSHKQHYSKNQQHDMHHTHAPIAPFVGSFKVARKTCKNKHHT
jgi:hypothetical protein